MSCPDSIVVSIDEGVAVSITPSVLPGSISVQSETPDIIEINTNSGAVGLGELVSGDPSDGSIIVYDLQTNTYTYVDATTIVAGGVFSSGHDVTNISTALGDAVGESYSSPETIESALRDILSPSNASIKEVLPSWSYGLNPGYKIPIGRGFPISSVFADVHRPWAATNSSLSVSVDGGQIGSAGSAAGVGGRKVYYEMNGSSHSAVTEHGSKKVIRFFNGLNGYDYSDMLYYGRAAYLSYLPSSLTADPSLANQAYTNSVSFDVPDSEEYSGHEIFLKGSSFTESPDNYTYIAIPAALRIDSIAEVTADAGVSDRSFSFDSNNQLYTVVFGSVSYDVYFHQSTQKGSLKEGSSLKIRLKTT